MDNYKCYVKGIDGKWEVLQYVAKYVQVVERKWNLTSGR